MPKMGDMPKSIGLNELIQRLLGNKGRETRKELSRHFKVAPSTIGRWLDSLSAQGIHYEEDEQRRVWIDRSRYFAFINLTRDESILLMLGLRLLQQFMDKPNSYSIDLLSKLGAAFHQGQAPLVGQYVQQMAEYQRQEQASERPYPDPQVVLSQIGKAWLTNLKVEIWYTPLHGHKPFHDVIHPYFIEPSAIGHSTYVIAYSEMAANLRVYKLERIKREPTVLNETFEANQELDVQRLLRGAWGIWFNKDEQPTRVVLRFSPHARQRINENRWHPSEQKHDDQDGYVIWQAEVDEPKEMMPWIRGWGADCEIIEPADLRKQHIQDIQRQVAQYRLNPPQATNTEPDISALGTLLGDS